MDKAPRRASVWAAYKGRSSHHTEEICCLSSERLGHFLPPDSTHEHKSVPKHPVLLCAEHYKKPWHTNWLQGDGSCSSHEEWTRFLFPGYLYEWTSPGSTMSKCSLVVGLPGWHILTTPSAASAQLPDFVSSSLGRTQGCTSQSLPDAEQGVTAGCDYWGGASCGFIKSELDSCTAGAVQTSLEGLCPTCVPHTPALPCAMASAFTCCSAALWGILYSSLCRRRLQQITAVVFIACFCLVITSGDCTDLKSVERYCEMVYESC